MVAGVYLQYADRLKPERRKTRRRDSFSIFAAILLERLGLLPILFRATLNDAPGMKAAPLLPFVPVVCAAS